MTKFITILFLLLQNETVFAGFDENDQEIGGNNFFVIHREICLFPYFLYYYTVGRLCQLRETAASEKARNNCSDLQTYIDTLETPASCNSGEPGILVWRPDENTPDLVYYQVYHVFTVFTVSFSGP